MGHPAKASKLAYRLRSAERHDRLQLSFAETDSTFHGMRRMAGIMDGGGIERTDAGQPAFYAPPSVPPSQLSAPTCNLLQLA